MCRFSVYKRRKCGLYYAEFTDESTGKRVAFRSTGKSKVNEALSVAAGWAANGIPDKKGTPRPWVDSRSAWETVQSIKTAPLSREDATRIVMILRERGLLPKDDARHKGPSGEPFCAWLRTFWAYESSPYIAERLAHGQRATRRHCEDMSNRVKDIEKIIGSDIAVGEIRRIHLNTLGVKLREAGLAASTVNKTISTATTALRWAASNELIPIDPTHGLRGFSGQKRKRGILSVEEAEKLFALQWEDERAKTACLVAMTTGMRLGEVLAIQRQDIGDTRIAVRHSFNPRDGLKKPKNGEERNAVMLPGVKKALLALEAASPHPATGERYVFAGRYPDRPLDANRILLGFRQALVMLHGVSWEDKDKRDAVLKEYSEKFIDFHSWRHFYAKHMADRVDARTGQLGTGHKSTVLFEEYANHTTERDMKRLEQATSDAFGSIFGDTVVPAQTA